MTLLHKPQHAQSSFVPAIKYKQRVAVFITLYDPHVYLS